MGQPVPQDDLPGIAVPADDLPDAPRKKSSQLGNVLDFYGSRLAGNWEAGANVISNMVATPIAGLAGIGQGIANQFGTPGMSAADRVEQVQQGMTYEPRTETGQNIVQGVTYPFAKLGQFADWAGSNVSEQGAKVLPNEVAAGAGAGVNALIQLAPAILLNKAVKARTAKAAQPEIEAARQAAYDTAKTGPNVVAEQVATKRAQAYVAGRTSLDWNALPGSFQKALASIAEDATTLSKLDPAALERQVRLQSLPEPVPATRGQLTQDPVQLLNEGTTAATQGGKPIRDIHVQQNKALLDNLEILKSKQGGVETTAEGVGRAVQDSALKAKLKVQEAKVTDLYKKARASGETDALVDVTPLIDMIEKTPDVTQYGWVQSWLNKVGAERGSGLSINDLEVLRQANQAKLMSSDGTVRHYAGQLTREIDRATEGAGGELYKAARAARTEQALRFEDPAAIERLVTKKPGSRTDRTTALEDTWRKTVIGGSIDDLRLVKQELQGGEGATQAAGIQAWRELQTQTAQFILDEATKSVARFEDGTPNVTPAAMQRAIKNIERAKLEIIFGEESLKTLDQIMDATRIVKSEPPTSFKGSATTPRLLAFFGRWGAKIPFIGKVGRGAAEMAANMYREGDAARQVNIAQQTPLDSGASSATTVLGRKAIREEILRKSGAASATQQRK